MQANQCGCPACSLPRQWPSASWYAWGANSITYLNNLLSRGDLNFRAWCSWRSKPGCVWNNLVFLYIIIHLSDFIGFFCFPCFFKCLNIFEQCISKSLTSLRKITCTWMSFFGADLQKPTHLLSNLPTCEKLRRRMRKGDRARFNETWFIYLGHSWSILVWQKFAAGGKIFLPFFAIYCHFLLSNNIKTYQTSSKQFQA